MVWGQPSGAICVAYPAEAYIFAAPEPIAVLPRTGGDADTERDRAIVPLQRGLDLHYEPNCTGGILCSFFLAPSSSLRNE